MSCELNAAPPSELGVGTLECARPDSGPPTLLRRKTQILIVDEEGIMRDGLCALLMSDSTLEIVGAASSGREAVQAAAGVRPDVIVIDFSMAMKTGPETIANLKRRWPDARVLVLTFRHEDHFIDAVLRAGADGYVLKNDSRTELFAAIRSVAGGKSHFSPSIHDRVVSGYVESADSTQRRKGAAAGMLTTREREVITLIAKGHRTREIAQFLSLSHKTVEKHRSNLMRKLGLRTATAVAAYAISHGYVEF
jgi:DNA-binding NarL/FixJ family response regulator